MTNKSTLRTISLTCLLLITSFTSIMVTAEQTIETLLDEDFESSGWGENPDFLPLAGWSTNSYFYMNSFFGESHQGSHHAFSYTNNDSMITPTYTFGQDTELTFWYAADSSDSPQSIEVYVDSMNLIWNDTDFTHTDYIQATIDLSGYTGQHFIEFVNSGSTGTYGQMIDDVVLTTYVDEEPSSDPGGSSDDDDSGSAMPPPADSNQDPTASFTISKANPIIDEAIIFNASSSSDADGDSLSFSWDFGDGSSEEAGITVSHSFEAADTYDVTLTVSDGNGGSDTNVQQVIVTTEGNTAPKQPSIQIDSTTLSIDTEYWFVISSIDDGDQLKFTIDWGDDQATETEYFESTGLNVFQANVSHQWTERGIFKVTIQAIDNENIKSKIGTITVIVDVNVISIDDVIVGYLVDFDKDDTFTQFYNADTDEYVNVEMHGNKSSEDFPSADSLVYFLIDIDDDGEFEYNYSKINGLLVIGDDASEDDTQNDNSDDGSKDEAQNESSEDAPGFELVFVLLAVFTLMFVYKRRR